MDNKGVSWTSQTHIHNDRSGLWIVGLAAVLLIIAVAVFLITRQISGSADYLSPLVVLVFGALLIMTVVRKPSTHKYSINQSSIKVDDRNYDFEQFNAFSIKEISGIYEIDLTPVERFRWPLTVYCTDKELNDITAFLEPHLPLKEPNNGWVDQVMHRLKF